MREMKDSGIEWIGCIPKDWGINTIFQLCTQVKNKNLGLQEKNLLSLSYGKIKRKNIDTVEGLLPESFDGYNIIDKDDIVLRLTDLQNDHTSLRVGISEERGIITSAYLTLRNRGDFVPKYLYYYLYSFDISKGFYGMGAGVRQGLNWDGVKWLQVLAPLKDEQGRIATFLDIKCAKIDAVLEKTRASIDEYKKLKQAVITQAVTKGIRGDRPMKDSGSIWFGNIPVDWDMKKIKYLFHIKKDIAGQEGYTVLSITQKGIVPKDLSKNEGQLAENYSHYQLVNPGDYAMNHMDLLTGWVDISKYTGVTSPDYRVFVLDDLESNNRSFYLYLMQMCYSNRIFYGLGQGVSGMGRWRLQADKFLNFSIVVPSKDEQQEIADYLDAKCAEIDNLISKKEQYITEIENYKKSLIYEYVTGKKEVI